MFGHGTAIARLQVFQPHPAVTPQRLVIADPLCEEQPLDSVDVFNSLGHQRLALPADPAAVFLSGSLGALTMEHTRGSRRGRLLIVSANSPATACPLSGRHSTYRPVHFEAGSVILVQERLVGRRSVGSIGPHPARRIALVEQALAQTTALIGSRICGRPSADEAETAIDRDMVL